MDGFYEVETVDRNGLMYEWMPQNAQSLISLVVALFQRITILNTVLFLIKYVPTSIYVYKLMKDAYIKTKDKMSRNIAAFEDIQSQIIQLNEKIGARSNEIMEQSAEVKRASERLHQIRSQVKQVIESDEIFKALRDCTPNPEEINNDGDTTKIHEHETDINYLNRLMKVFNCDKMNEPCDIGAGEHAFQGSPENSVYCSLNSTEDANKETTIKLLKVTNVYKVAYLRNIVKQKQLLRANGKTMLEEKMENIKKLLDDWHKTLEMVTKERIIELTNQQCQDDIEGYISRTNSGSDIKTDDVNLDDSDMNWSQETSPYHFGYDYEKHAEDYDGSDFYVNRMPNGYTCTDCRNKLFCLGILPEETVSQMDIESVKQSESENQGD